MIARNGTTPRLERRSIVVRGRRVAYETAGTGEPLVLVHGLFGSSRWWARNVRSLAERHAVYVVNLPGFGALRWRGPRFVLREAADWLADWLAAVGIGPCHLVGHSMGGYIAVRLAARRPELVQRLVLVAPAGVPSERSMIGYGVPLLATSLAATPSFLPVLALDAVRAGPLTILRAARDLLAADVCDYLRAIAAPTLLVWGDRDTLVPASLGPATSPITTGLASSTPRYLGS